MTNKEAIEHLKELKTLRIEFPNTLQEQAINLALKALHTVEIIEEELGPAYEEMAIWFDVPHFEEIQERAEMRVKHELNRVKDELKEKNNE